jgi:hypothetical protein
MSFAIDMSRYNLCFALCLFIRIFAQNKVKKKKTLKKKKPKLFTHKEKGKKRLKGQKNILMQKLKM